MTESQHRFLKEIADRAVNGRIAEVRLYPTVRVGQVESGVAIVALEVADAVNTIESLPDQAMVPEQDVAGEPVVEGGAVATDRLRLPILTAHFRHTVKGPDRGKWEFAMVHDADAPLETVESVVRGVARRAGEDAEPELLDADAFQKVISEPWWTTTA
jgi:hypothetical protein